MRFSKYHGCQNDFIVILDEEMTPAVARQLCDRHAGIGADGVALVTLSPGLAPPRMQIINADGSQPEMCGNALRCVVKHLVDNALVDEDEEVHVITDAGLLSARTEMDKDGRVKMVTVDMGPPREPVQAKMCNVVGRPLRGHTVSMGNPHFVIESPLPMRDAQSIGQQVSTHLDFPEGTNASFVHVLDKNRCEAVVFERGAGLTMACGTGACAIVAVGQQKGWFGSDPVEVQLPGGRLTITRFPDGHLHMRGAAVWVFDGECET
ncbi:MAG: diaminopimelate epimerase [Deltaproteobacteria bacterium]|nr:diaminopimelate epimerase [Deltaproteobacteria bacterium]